MIMKNRIFLLLFLTTTFLVYGQKRNNENSKETETSNEIVGTWKLIEFSNLDKTTNVWTHPYGKNPNGYFSYSKSGIININISSEIPLQIPKDSLKNFKINMLDFRTNYAVGYYGTYTVDKEKGLVIHHVKGGAIPEYVNTDQSRPFILKNDTLIIGDIKTWRRVLIKVD